MDKKFKVDFSNIAAKKIVVETPKPIKPSQPPPELTGIMLSIPTKDHNIFLNRDLGDCTKEEFIAWVKSSYHASTEGMKCDTINDKIGIFSMVLQWHQAIKILSKATGKPLC